VGLHVSPDMGFTIQLDDQPSLSAKEINNIGAKPDLLPELQFSNLPPAKVTPKPFLRLGPFTPQSPLPLQSFLTWWPLHPLTLPCFAWAPPSPLQGEGFQTNAMSGASSAFMPIT